MTRLTLSVIIALCVLCSMAFPQEVVLSWTHGVQDPTYTNTSQRSPATVLTHTGGSGDFTQGLHVPLTFVPRQSLHVNGVEWTLQWLGGRGGSWFWTHPDYTSHPFTYGGSWVTHPGDLFPTYTYVLQPQGLRFQAPTIYANRLGWSQDIWWNHRLESTLGGASTSRVYGTTPGVYGSCTVSDQHLGAPGNLYGLTSLPSFFAWTWDQWQSGLVIFGPDPYAIATNTIADFDGSESRSLNDLFSFLESWLSHGLAADLDHNGHCSENDLFVFLDCWFRP